MSPHLGASYSGTGNGFPNCRSSLTPRQPDRPRFDSVERMRETLPFPAAILAAMLTAASAVALAEPGIPPHNLATLKEPPERPMVGDADEKAKRLFDAIVYDDPTRASDFFLPRDAFLSIKAMKEPGRYYDRLLRRYMEDIHALHRSLKDPEHAEFERFELVKRGAWMKVGEEGNRLPYWASRHSWLHYRIGAERHRIEVRVLIAWDNRWYITHLSEFH